MNFTIIEADQRSEAWRIARAGRATGSKADCVIAKLKTAGEAATRRDYRFQLAAERLTGMPQEDGYTNSSMQWGIENEPFARMAYEAATGNEVRETGFLQHNDMMIGCSLDGDVGHFAGIIEIKCPKTATHIGYITAGSVPSTYLPQIKHNLLVTGAEWCDFISYDPRLPDNLKLFVARVTRQQAGLAEYETELLAFLREVDSLEKQLRDRA